MPHIELKYTDDITMDTQKLFVSLEAVINDADPSAGACKCRAYMVSDYLHSHVILSIKVLHKAHRDDKFMRALLGQIEMVIAPVLPRDCFYSIDLDFVGDYYLTSKAS